MCAAGAQQSGGPGVCRVLYVLTAPFGLEKTLGGQLRYLRRAGFEPCFACSPGEQLDDFAARERVYGEAIPIEREIAPVQDLKTLWRLWRLMRRLRPAVTNVSAPKAGLLGGLAAWLAAVPCRVYTLRGLRLETARGAKYTLLWAAEWLACRLAHRVVCVSRVLAQRAIELGLARPGQVVIPGPGSSNGVDARHFEPRGTGEPRVAELRQRWGIPPEAPVLGFVGRFTHDKGIADLVAAYYLLQRTRPQLRLLLVGCFESGDPVPAVAREAIESDPGIVVTGFLDDPAVVYQLMDVVALPTYREGYPTVALEAAAAGRPFVTTAVTGAAESVEHGVTGLLAPPGDSRALAAAVASLLDDPEWAAAMARRARRRVVKEFSQQRVWQAIAAVYDDLLRERQRGASKGGASKGGVGTGGFGTSVAGLIGARQADGACKADRVRNGDGARNGDGGCNGSGIMDGGGIGCKAVAYPGTAKPGIANPGMVRAGMARLGIGGAGTDHGGTGHEGMGHEGMDGAETDRTGMARAGMAREAVSSGWALSPRKRAFDIVFAVLGLALAAPLLLLATAGIAVTMGRPILFCQSRLGLRGRPFAICKLRTMDAPIFPELLPDERRLTPLGRLLRRWSLDELPQLWNVLRGEMSLVGPRPLPLDYAGRYSPRQHGRHEVKPGLTGWAQATGRNGLGWDERFELDLWYVAHASWSLDLRILARSAGVVFGGAGVGPPGADLMPEFLGDQHDAT
jgi:lipopolysaccharide/colanic/teichoic acid biosynthesis glycosyltransferase/glycosyltransferase involved in cell wall biosynthesis